MELLHRRRRRERRWRSTRRQAAAAQEAARLRSGCGRRRSAREAAATLPARGGVAGVGGSGAGCGRGAPHGAASMRAVGREGWEREEVRV